jgi:hypothetical protein
METVLKQTQTVPLKGRIPIVLGEAEVFQGIERKYVAFSVKNLRTKECVEILRFGDRKLQHCMISEATVLEIWFNLNGGVPKDPRLIPTSPRVKLLEQSSLKVSCSEVGSVSVSGSVITIYDYGEGTVVAERILKETFDNEFQMRIRKASLALPRLLRR